MNARDVVDSRWVTLAVAAACVCSAMSVTGCRDATAIVVDVETDLPCADESLVTTAITAGTPEGYASSAPLAVTTRCDAATGHIGSLVLLPSTNDNAEIVIQVVTATRGKGPDSCTSDPASCIVERRRMRYIPHTTLDVPIHMIVRCLGSAPSAGCTSDPSPPDPSVFDAGPPPAPTSTDASDAAPRPPPTDASDATPPPPPPVDAGAPTDAGDADADEGGGNGNGNGNGHGKPKKEKKVPPPP